MTKVIILKGCSIGQCPRIGVSGGNSFFRDDYKGNVRVSSKLLAKLLTLS